jgi:iron complex transport system substrate-binding protein
LFESVYESVLVGRLRSRGLKVERQVQVKAVFDGEVYDPAFKIDMLVDDRLVLEIKAVEQLSKAHAKQLLTYLRLLKQPVGLLLNFSEATMKDGIRRVVNDYKSG